MVSLPFTTVGERWVRISFVYIYESIHSSSDEEMIAGKHFQRGR
jgi:hypothetical protein